MGRVAISNSKQSHENTDMPTLTDKPGQYLMRFNSSSSDSVTRDETERVVACETRRKPAKRGCHDSSQRRAERRNEDRNTSDWPTKSLALRPGPFPSPLTPPPHRAVPVLTATSHTLHLPSGSGRQQKGQLADS